MDVNGVIQNQTVVNAYNSKSNFSEYEQANSGTVVSDVKTVGVQQSSQDNSVKETQCNKGDLDEALTKINNFMKDERVHAEYSVHKDLGTIMIKIVNEDTKEVLLEVPPQKILDMVASICKQFGLLDRKA